MPSGGMKNPGGFKEDNAGEVAERFKAVVLKTTARKRRGFESLPLLRTMSTSRIGGLAVALAWLALTGGGRPVNAAAPDGLDGGGPARIGDQHPALEVETLD